MVYRVLITLDQIDSQLTENVSTALILRDLDLHRTFFISIVYRRSCTIEIKQCILSIANNNITNNMNISMYIRLNESTRTHASYLYKWMGAMTPSEIDAIEWEMVHFGTCAFK